MIDPERMSNSRWGVDIPLQYLIVFPLSLFFCRRSRRAVKQDSRRRGFGGKELPKIFQLTCNGIISCLCEQHLDPADVEEVRITSLAGLGASYRIAGRFRLRPGKKPPDFGSVTINFKGVAFGGHYGGHNVNVELSGSARKKLIGTLGYTEQEVEELLSEVQRRLLNGEMVVEYSKLDSGREKDDNPLGNLGI